MPPFLTQLLVSIALPFCTLAEETTAFENAAPKNIGVAEAGQLIQKNEVVILDVRTPEEFGSGHLKGATNLDINASDFQEKLATLDKEKKYLIHCEAGGRSKRAATRMKGLGFATVYNLEGGIKAWEAAGQKTER